MPIIVPVIAGTSVPLVSVEEQASGHLACSHHSDPPSANTRNGLQATRIAKCHSLRMGLSHTETASGMHQYMSLLYILIMNI